jgi:L-seryl-tRNA(Ser) seleniumtransferase
LIDLNSLGIHDEPTVAHSLKAGASVVTFSGDKLLGGPQSGIILGEAEIIRRIKSNPLMRVLRVDKLIYAALEATIAAYLSGRAVEEIPVQAALHLPKEAISRRARAFVRRARNLAKEFQFNLVDGNSVIGGGSAPETQLPTTLVTVASSRMTAGELEEKLRLNSPPIIARIVEDRLALDLRTVAQPAEKEILSALAMLTTNK